MVKNISNNNQSLLADYTDGDLSRFSMIGGQRIERYSVYADQKHQLSKEWNLGYGVSYRFAKDRDFQTYSQVTGDIYTQDTYSDLKEQTAGFYVSLGRNYASGTSFSISATGEYYTIGNITGVITTDIKPKARMVLQHDVIHMSINIFVYITGLIITICPAIVVLVGSVAAGICYIDIILIVKVVFKCSSKIMIPIFTAQLFVLCDII